MDEDDPFIAIMHACCITKYGIVLLRNSFPQDRTRTGQKLKIYLTRRKLTINLNSQSVSIEFVTIACIYLFSHKMVAHPFLKLTTITVVICHEDEKECSFPCLDV